MKVLGIETSCDETAVAVVEIDEQTRVCRMLSNAIVSQIDIHAAYGGVVPEVAARSHIEAMTPTLDESLNIALPTLKDASVEEKMAGVDAIAVTYGAGLGGSLLIGVTAARALAIATGKPLYAINHVEGHVYANFITETSGEKLKDGKWNLGNLGSNSPTTIYQLPTTAPEFPLLALIVSGKHSQLVLFRDHFDYDLLGSAQDDAIGEAFDKVAKMTGLPYPGGPSIAKAALNGDAYTFDLPKAKLSSQNSELRTQNYDFSFSGLKTAVLRLAQGLVGADYRLASFELPGRLSDAQKADIAASFQRIAIETVVDKTVKAFERYSPASVVLAGGVASSTELRRQLTERIPIQVNYTDPKLCTDNGAMIATLGCFKALLGAELADPYSLEINPSLKM